MKNAIVHQRGRNALGRRMVCVICPTCRSRHWISTDQPTATCPRRPNRALSATKRRAAGDRVTACLSRLTDYLTVQGDLTRNLCPLGLRTY
jgi:ssDNA-binding Zn-finger/Zn-ribbon topoisomerase 1